MDVPNAASLKDCTKKGYLQKLSSRSFPYIQHTWKRKYCVLAGGALYFYDRDDAKGVDKGSGVVNLEYFDQVVEAGPKEAKKASHAFVVTSQDRTFFDPGRHLFSADTAASMNDWVKNIQKAIEQTRNNNKSKAAVPGGAAAAALNQSNSAPNNRPGGGAKTQGKSTEVLKEKKTAGPDSEADKAKKRLSGADADKGVENKENNKDWTTSEERKSKPSDSSLRRRKPGGSRTTDDDVADLDNSKNFYSLGRKKPEADQTPTGSLGRKTNPKTKAAGTLPEEIQGSKMGGKSKEIGKKRKADDEGLEDGGDVAMEVPETSGQLESVTKNRVKGPAGRRMPQHRRTQLMKHRASSLSALAHTAADAGNPDNPANRSALVLPSQGPPPDPLRPSTDSGNSRGSVPQPGSRNGYSSSVTGDDKVGSLHDGIDAPTNKGKDEKNGIDDERSLERGEKSEDGQNCELIDSSEIIEYEKDERENASKINSGDSVTQRDEQETTHSKDDVRSEQNESEAPDTSVVDEKNKKNIGGGVEDNSGLVDVTPSELLNNSSNDCINCKLCSKCQRDMACCKVRGKVDEAKSSVESEENLPSSINQPELENVDEAGTQSKEDNIFNAQSKNENKCHNCGGSLKFDSEPVPKDDKTSNGEPQHSVSIRSKDTEDTPKKTNADEDLRPFTQIETVEMDTFDDIDDALFFRPRTMYGVADENANEDKNLKAKKDQHGKAKSKKRVTLDKNSGTKSSQSRTSSDAKSKLSRFRKTLTSFRRVRLKTEGTLVDNHPDECGSTRKAFCTIL